jgi:hypothetical protein
MASCVLFPAEWPQAGSLRVRVRAAEREFIKFRDQIECYIHFVKEARSMKLIRFFCMATLIALLFWIFPSNSIEVSLSSESGGNWATISSEYDADPDDSITEHAEASFMPVRVQSMRQASFSGNFHAEQTAFGSKGVSGGSHWSSVKE